MRRMTNMLLCATAAGCVLFCAGGAGAGVIPPLSSAVGRAVPAQIVSVQMFGYYYTAYGRYPWDYKWGGPPYAFPYGDQSHVMYYPGPSYYYPGFQTTMATTATWAIRRPCSTSIRRDGCMPRRWATNLNGASATSL